ncbi:MAG: serine acetyltransferase [Clostridia bacterium]
MNINLDRWYVRFLLHRIQHYNHKKYWEMRSEVINPDSKKPKWLRLYWLYRIKKSDAFNNASMGTDLGKGALFQTPPRLPHGLNGIIVSHFAKIGANCTIHQQVSISQAQDESSAIIGDNCMIGAGAKIMGTVKIGDNVKIGANAVVTTDLPSNCTAVGVPARIIEK